MKYIRQFKPIILIIIVSVFLVFIGFNFVQAQGKGKPPKKPKCNYNGICEKGENSDCPDCQQEPSPPLLIEHGGLQIVSGSGISDKKVYQIKHTNGNYSNTWYSSVNEGSTSATSIGDVDNDGLKEITTVVSAKKSKGPPRQRYSYTKIFIYEDGSTGEPSYMSHDLGHKSYGVRDSIIADADGDGLNEIVLVVNDHIEIYEWDGSGFSQLWIGPSYDESVWSVDVGDADNDGFNEIVLAMFRIGSAIVYDYLGDNTWGNPVMTESIGSYNMDQAKIEDVDGDGFNEIIGGGTSNRLNIWKYIDGYYLNVFLSEDLGGFTQGVDAGDVDGDGLNEVIASSSGEIDRIYIFKYNEITMTFEMIASASLNSGVARLATGDLDNDNIDEIAVGSSGVSVFKLIDGILDFIYNFSEAGYLEIG
jgi:hypothetical protein